MPSLNDDNSSPSVNKQLATFDPALLTSKILRQAAAQSAVDSKYTLAAAVDAAKIMIGNGVQRTTETIKTSGSNFKERFSLNVPIPLPIESAEISTEKTLTRVLTGIENYGHIMEELLPLKNVARESTLTRVADGIGDLSKKILHSMTGTMNSFGDSNGIFQTTSKTMMSRLGDLTRAYLPFGEIIAGKIEGYTTPLLEMTKKQTDYAKQQLDLWRKWFIHQRTLDVRDDSQDPNRVTGIKGFAMNLASVLPGAETIKKAFQATSAMAAFYGAVAGSVGSMLLPLLGRLGISVGAGAGGAAMGAVSALLAPITAFLGGFAAFVGGVAVLAAAPILYSLYKSPELIGKYLEAFGNIWTQNIAPTFAFLYEEIMKPLGEAISAWWNSTGESAFRGIGDFFNETFIYLFGTAIPAALTTLGKVFLAAYETIKTQVNLITGLFGGDINIFEYLGSTIINLLELPAKLLDAIVTGIINLFNLDTFFDMKEGETFVERLQRFFTVDILNMIDRELTNIVTSVGIMWDDAKTSFLAFVNKYNPIALIEEKVKAMIDAVVGIFPSIDDIKRFMINAIPSGTPETIKNWLIDAIGKPADAPVIEPASSQKFNSEMSDIYRNFVKEPVGQSAPTIILNAPQNTQNNNTNNVASGGRGKPGGVAATRPQSNPWENKLYGIPLAY